MTGWIIALSIIAFLVVLSLIIKIDFRLELHNSVTDIKVKIAGINLYPRKIKKKVEKTVEKTDTSKIKELLPEFSKICKLIKKLLGLFRRKLKIRKLHIGVVVATDDAAKTGIEYSVVSSLIYIFQGILLYNFEVSDIFFNVIPDFVKEKMEVDVSLRITIKLFDTFIIALAILIGVIKIYRKSKNKSNIKKAV